MRVGIDGMLLGRRYSGVEASIANLIQALAAGGRHDYVLFASSRVCAGAAPGGRVQAVPCRWPVRVRAVRILWEQLALPRRLTGQRLAVLHAPGYVAPLRSAVPVVITVYDLIALLFPELCTPSNRWHYGRLIPWSLRKAARIIVPSAATRADLIRLFPAQADKVRVIPLGIGAQFQSTRDEHACAAVRRKYGLPGPFVLFVGKTEPKKNLVRLVEAYQLLRSSGQRVGRLVIAGAPAWDHDNVVRACRLLGLQEEVVFTGFVPPEDLPSLYQLADLLVFPSLYEGFGLPPLEAMASGVPVVLSNRGALPEVAGDAAVAADPLSPQALANAMGSLLANPARRADLIARGLARARTFSWAAAAAATERVYEEAAGLGAGP